jgi:NADH:ubiquinone oxidoreductase subunit H
MDDPVLIGKSIAFAIWNFLEVHPWILITLIAHGAILGAVAYLILLERKIASWVQDRIGPNRVGLGFGIIPWLKDKKMMGLGQPLADGVKFILKEDYQPKGVDKYLFSAAPMMMIVVVILSIAVLPWDQADNAGYRCDVLGGGANARGSGGCDGARHQVGLADRRHAAFKKHTD